jgi:hypothetical protein
MLKFFDNAFNGLDQLVHSIFVIKIWAVALKIREIKKVKQTNGLFIKYGQWLFFNLA